MSNHNTYAVIELTDIDKIDFTQIGESSVFTIRKSLDDTQFVVPVGTYNHEQALILMATAAWSEPMPVE